MEYSYTVRHIADLIPAEYNPRVCSPIEEEGIRRSLIDFGFQGVVVVNTFQGRENIIVGGHQRVRIWQELGNATVPTVEVCLPLDREKILNLRLNKNTGHFDYGKLKEEYSFDDLRSVGFDDISFDMTPTPLSPDLSSKQSPRKPNETKKADSDKEVTVMVVVGYIRIKVPRSVFKEWDDALKSRVGFSSDNASKEIMRLLGFDTE